MNMVNASFGRTLSGKVRSSMEIEVTDADDDGGADDVEDSEVDEDGDEYFTCGGWCCKRLRNDMASNKMAAIDEASKLSIRSCAIAEDTYSTDVAAEFLKEFREEAEENMVDDRDDSAAGIVTVASVLGAITIGFDMVVGGFLRRAYFLKWLTLFFLHKLAL